MLDRLMAPKPGNPRSELQVGLARRIAEVLPGDDIVGVLLSGSSTWGDADASSDLDLQILVDRDPPYREVTCVRVSDLLGERPFDGPTHVDLDRVSATYYREGVEKGGLTYRVVHGLILRDRAGFLANMQRQAVAEFVKPEAYRARFEAHRAQVEFERTGARGAESEGDTPLARLRARAMLAAAAVALLDFADDRVSNHLVDAAVKALAFLGRADLGPGWLHGMAVDGGAGGVDRALRAWRRFGEVALEWLVNPEIGGRLNDEDRAWVAFNWSDEIVEEMELRRAALTRLGKLPALQYYADGKLTVPVRISFGKYLALLESGRVGRKDLAGFHTSLRIIHPGLFGEWLAGLRLEEAAPSLAASEELADEILALGERALEGMG